MTLEDPSRTCTYSKIQKSVVQNLSEKRPMDFEGFSKLYLGEPNEVGLAAWLPSHSRCIPCTKHAVFSFITKPVQEKNTSKFIWELPIKFGLMRRTSCCAFQLNSKEFQRRGPISPTLAGIPNRVGLNMFSVGFCEASKAERYKSNSNCLKEPQSVWTYELDLILRLSNLDS